METKLVISFLLARPRDFTDVVGHDLGVARVDDADGIVVPRVGEENDDGFFHISGIRC